MTITCPSCKDKMTTLSIIYFGDVHFCSRCKLTLLRDLYGTWVWLFNTCGKVQVVNYPIPFELAHPGIEFVPLIKDAKEVTGIWDFTGEENPVDFIKGNRR